MNEFDFTGGYPGQPHTPMELKLSAELAFARTDIERLRSRSRSPQEAVYYCCDRAMSQGERTPKLVVLMRLTGLSMGAVARWRKEWIDRKHMEACVAAGFEPEPILCE